MENPTQRENEAGARPPPPPVLADERERLALLHALALLDTPPEPVFDRIVRLACRLLDVPMAAFTLIDADRLWSKARVGMDDGDIPRDLAFCSHAIAQEAPLVVPDLARDPRFAANPLVGGGPQVCFYAGVPVRSSGGLALGTLCALDVKPRELDPEQRAVLVDLAAIVMREVQYRERLVAARERLQHSDAVLDASEARFRAVFDIASVGIALTGADGRWIGVNAALCEILGYGEDELRGRSFADVTHEDDRAGDADCLARLAAGEIALLRRRKRYLRKDGSFVWVEVDVKRKTDAAGRHEYNVAVIKDIHAHKLAEEEVTRLNADLERRVAERTRELGEREEELRSVIDNASDAYIRLDRHGRVTAWNRHAEETFGWNATEALGRPLEELIIPAELSAAHRSGMRLHLAGRAARMIDRRVELPALRRDGSRLTVEVRIRRHEVRGEPAFSAFLHDVTARKRREAQREYETRHDALTGLPNRRALMEALPLAQARLARRGGTGTGNGKGNGKGTTGLGLLFIDLDGFKAVNDRLGHDGGDELLRVVAARLRAAVRRTDTVFRLAGDEFTVLLEDLCGAPGDAYRIGRKLIEAVSAPVPVFGGAAQVGASIGIALQAAGQACTPEALIKEADGWMYEAKKAGRGCILPRPDPDVPRTP